MKAPLTYFEGHLSYKEKLEKPEYRFEFAIKQLKNGYPLDVLDIGCGDGTFIGHLLKAGHRADGVEIDKEKLAVAKKNTGQVIFSSFNKVTKLYDAVVAIEVLEHLKGGPVVFLERMRKRLKPGGVIFFTVPIEIELLDADHRHFFDIYDVIELANKFSEDFTVWYIPKYLKFGAELKLFAVLIRC